MCKNYIDGITCTGEGYLGIGFSPRAAAQFMVTKIFRRLDVEVLLR